MRAEARRTRWVHVSALLLAVGVLVGCTDTGSTEAAGPDDAAPAGGTSVASYVALGDSYTAAPFVPDTDIADGCFRSDGNYPSLLADQLQPERFVDVSCSAADTSDLRSPQATADGRGQVRAQLRSVTADTELVTVGIGANDEQLFERLVTRCTAPAATTTCDDSVLGQAREVLPRTRERLVAALRSVHRRAPDALVVLVGYPRLVDPSDPCPLIPVPAPRLAGLAAVERMLDATMKRAARTTGTEYVDMRAASRGHEICSADPWVNGRTTDQEQALAYHPFSAEQVAVARRVLRVLDTQAGT